MNHADLLTTAINGVAEPPASESRIEPWFILGVFGVVVVAAAAFALYRSARERDLLPLACCSGALVCALNEPIYDILGKIVYATNHPMAYTAFDRDIPWFLVIGYLPWVGVLPWLISRMMAKGTARRTLHLIALGSGLSVVLVESLGTSFDAWTYYGEAPLKFLVVAPQMAPVPIVGGFLLFAVAESLTGWRRIGAAFVISTLALPIVFASASWPLYLGLNADLPTPVDWLAGAAMLALTWGIVVSTTTLAEQWRATKLAEQWTSGEPALR